MALAEYEAHVAPDEGVDFGRLNHLERGARVRNPCLERRETLRRRSHIGREDASTHALDRTERVHRGRFHLVAKGSMSSARRALMMSSGAIPFSAQKASAVPIRPETAPRTCW